MKSSQVRTVLNITAAIALLASSNAFGQGSKKPAPSAPAPSAAPAKGDEKLDVTDLEKKYWAAKDTEFNVVQNRTYAKAGRFALTLHGGQYVNDPWSSGYTYGGGVDYYFSERYGVEMAYTATNSKDNDATSNLKSQQGGAPNHNKMKGFYGVAFNWVPFYAKMSFLNSNILYFDMAVSPGVGIVTYEQQLDNGVASKTAPALTLDLTQQFFVSKHLALRLDYKNRFYNEDVTEYHVPLSGTRTTWTHFNYTSLLMFGTTFYF
jgi:outer membrane beta-barrel protein